MTWQIIKESYIKDHLAKTYLKQAERRLHALDAIEAEYIAKRIPIIALK